MLLPDYMITQDYIQPFSSENVQPCSYDLTLSDQFLTPKVLVETVEYILMPGEFLLASTLETVTIPSSLAGRVCGKSGLARNGLTVEAAGLIDPGFQGTITLEVFNYSDEQILLRKGMRIAQITFEYLLHPCKAPYGSESLNSHYQFQEGPVR